MRTTLPALFLLLGLAGLLPGCGDESGSSAEGPAGGATSGGSSASIAPTPKAPTPSGTPSTPAVTATADAEELLGLLRQRMQAGEGLASQVAYDDLYQLGTLLWPVAEGERAPVGLNAHVEAGRLSSEIARALAREPAARADWEKTNPYDVQVHDGLIAALGKGLEAYKAWCETDAPELLRKLKEDRIRRVGGR